MDLAPRAPKRNFSKNFMRTCELSWENLHVYLHFFTLIFVSISHFLWITQIPQFCVYMNLALRAPKSFSQTTLWGPPYLGGEPSCIVTAFFYVHFLLRKPFLGIPQIPQFFICINPWIWCRNTQAFFLKKLYEYLCIELGSHHLY